MSATEIKIEEGSHVLTVQAFKMKEDEPSAMDNYLSMSAIVKRAGNDLFLSVMFGDNKTITGFQIENEAGELVEANEKQANEEKNTRYEMFKIDKLKTEITARVQYEADFNGQTIKGDEEMRLRFDPATLEEIETMRN